MATIFSVEEKLLENRHYALHRMPLSVGIVKFSVNLRSYWFWGVFLAVFHANLSCRQTWPIWSVGEGWIGAMNFNFGWYGLNCGRQNFRRGINNFMTWQIKPCLSFDFSNINHFLFPSPWWTNPLQTQTVHSKTLKSVDADPCLSVCGPSEAWQPRRDKKVTHLEAGNCHISYSQESVRLSVL